MNNRSTPRSKLGLQLTRDDAERLLHLNATDGTTLTDIEKAFVAAHRASEFVQQFQDIIGYTGFDIELNNVPTYRSGRRLMESNCVGVRAVGAQYMLTVLLQRQGALEGILRGLWERLACCPLTADDIDILVDEVRHE